MAVHGFSEGDHRRVSDATKAVERLFKGDLPGNRLQSVSVEHLLPVRAGFLEEDLPSPGDFDHPTSAAMRFVAPSKSNPRAAARIQVTNRIAGYSASAGDYVQVLQIGDEWHPLKGGASAVSFGWLDEELEEFGRAKITVGQYCKEQSDVTGAVAAVTTGGAGAASFAMADDQTSFLNVGNKIRVEDSTGNDGKYTIRAGSSYSGGNTTINVDEAVSDSTVDGDLTILIYGALCETEKTAEVVDRVGLGGTLEKNTGIEFMAMADICDQPGKAVLAAPCELKDTRPLSTSGSPPACLSLSEVGSGSVTISG